MSSEKEGEGPGENEGGEESGETGAPKKVVVSDDLDVYEMDPNSTEVKQVEKPQPAHKSKPAEEPKPCDPAISEETMEKILNETIEIMDGVRIKSYNQKMAAQKFAFMLSCIQESLDFIACHVNKLNAFLVNNDDLQTRWYCQYAEHLLCYADYCKVLKDAPEGKVQVSDFEYPVSELELKKIAEQTTNNLYAGGIAIRAQRIVGKNIDDKLDFQIDSIEEMKRPFVTWFHLMNRGAKNQDILQDMVFKVQANVNFLQTGEMSDAIVLDLSKEMEALAKSS